MNVRVENTAEHIAKSEAKKVPAQTDTNEQIQQPNQPETTGQAEQKLPYARVPKGRLSASAARRWEDELRGRLGLTPLGTLIHPRERKIGWIVTAITALLATFTRFFRLGHPKELIFDETYYVKGAYSLLHHGFEASWADDIDNAFVSGDFSGLNTSEAAYVVHPPFGKWIMAIGQGIFGSDSAIGWRFSTALIGVLAVILVVRIALRLFRSPLLAGVAGFAMSLDGMGITMSRTGLLDNILALFILLGFWAVLRDREYSRARLAHAAAHGYLTRDGTTRDVWGPSLFFRPWLLVAAVFLGCSMGVKWSGIYAVAVFGILVFIWGVTARRAVGAPLFMGAGVFREGLPAFVQLVPLAFVTYIACWISWFTNPHSWDRQWATTADPSELPLSWAPDAVNSFLHYHKAMWDFHNGLDTPHDYQSQAWAWIVQARPVSFYWKGTEEMTSACPDSECVQAISSIGNIGVWWLGVLALVALIVLGIRRADWRAGAIGAGYIAVWAPWFLYSNRTIFQFYAIALLPFVVLALAWAIGAVAGALSEPHSPRRLSPSELFAGEQETWRAGVWTENGCDETECLPDFPERKCDGLEPEDSEDDGRVSVQDEEKNLDATENQEAANREAAESSEHNIYARLFSRLTSYMRPVSSGTAESDEGENTKSEWWHEKSNTREYALVGVVLGVISVIAILWYPLWIGSTITYDYWHLHMWFQSWI